VGTSSVDARASLTSDDPLARSLRGFGPVGILVMLGILVAPNDFYLPLGAILVLLWAWRSHTPLRELGFVRPKSWILTAAAGIAFGVAFKFLMKAIVMPLLGADPINHAYHYLAGNRAALPGAIYLMIVGAGFGEETVFRGFAFERLGKIFGRHTWAKPLIVLLTSVLFGLGHYWVQGLAGAEQGLIVGLVYGTIFAITGSIWFLMFAHAAFDLTALAIIYLNIEPAVAHLVFN
jgi:CAAX protease family protein